MGKVDLDLDLGIDPVAYARRLLAACGLREPPICEKAVADHLGLEIKEFSLNGVPEAQALRGVLQTACASLDRKTSQIRVYEVMSVERKRMSILHECGHAVLPWHEKFQYRYTGQDVDYSASTVEREAFAFATQVMMPAEVFGADIRSEAPSMKLIEDLSCRYEASLEATAIRYAKLNASACAVVMAEEAGPRKARQRARSKGSQEQSGPRLLLPPPEAKCITDKSPLRVKYCVASKSFPMFLRPGTPVGAETSVFRAWADQHQIRDEIPASGFGWSSTLVYQAECLPFCTTGRMLVLLWLPDYQMELSLLGG